MQKKLVAIGGGENGRVLENGEFSLYETEAIDREIVMLSGKQKPNFLFLAHSQANSLEIQESYFQTMKKIYGDRFGCNCLDLKSNELDNIDVVKKKIEWADIIYEGGGDTALMIELWNKTGFSQILYDAFVAGKVICGISAGAVCWFESCNSDLGLTFESVDCLGWFSGHITPHCNEDGRYESTKKQLYENGKVGIMLSNCTALEIIDDKYKIIKSVGTNLEQNIFVLKGYWDGNVYFEEKLESLDYISLDKFFDKN